jgi:S-adenosylhomocysteine hydrolase
MTSTSNDALKRWADLPADKRRLLLDNVWCPDCSTAVTICDFSAQVVAGKGVVLKGFCGKCGHKVARVLEGM